MKEYITEENTWDTLKKSDKPIVLYGMGNGADQIIDVLNAYSIPFHDIFASDGFVRGQTFHGKTVCTYSDIEKKYDDFIIVMTFAVHDRETMARVQEMSARRTLLSPTVPIAGNGLFTRAYFEKNADAFSQVYQLLADEKSKQTYTDVINFKISGKIKYLFHAHSEKTEIYHSFFKLSDHEAIFDLGAYDGDTISEFITAAGGKYDQITALEPDEKNFRKLLRNTKHLENIRACNLGAWSDTDTLYFSKKAGRQSRLDCTGTPVQVTSVDNLTDDKAVTLIKMDIEGSELQAIRGAEKTIRKYRPKLYICAYHRNEDLFALPLEIVKYNPGYKMYFRQHPYIPAWESNFYFV